MKRINNKNEGYKFIALTAFLFLLFSTCYAEAAEYNASYTPGSISCIKAGQTMNVSVTLKNMGTLTWKPGTTFLSYHLYQGGAYPVWDGERTSLPKSVAPNETITLNAKVTANVPVGSCTLKWDMLGPTTWFSLKSPPVPTGNQTVEVKSDCISKQSVRAQVQTTGALNSLNALCQIIDCSGAPATLTIPEIEVKGKNSVRDALSRIADPPTITGIEGFVGPTVQIVVKGKGFGNTPGRVLVNGNFPQGSPQVYQSGHGTYWQDDAILTGPFPDMDKVGYLGVTIQVERADKKVSNKHTTTFYPHQDLVFLPNEKFQAPISVERCDNGQCDTEYLHGYAISTAHVNYHSGEMSGYDIYVGVVSNGWIFDGRVYGWEIAGEGDKRANYIVTRESDETIERIQVNWWLGSCGSGCDVNWINYLVRSLLIIGPKGVNWQ